MIALVDTWFNYRSDTNITNDNFLSFADKFAAQKFQNTNYSANMRWNFSDPFLTTDPRVGIGMDISGYGARSNLTQYFTPENIVILYDGLCASTCTLTSEMLRIQGGVQSVVLGGRPQYGPMQGVGGIKGAQSLEYQNIFDISQQVIAMTKDEDIKSSLSRYTSLPLRRSTSSGVNGRDQILRDNVHDGVPAQYITENADCRLYWTAPMVVSVSEIWKAAADAAFNGARCLDGGIAGSSSTKRVAPVTRAHARVQRLSEQIIEPPISRLWIWEVTNSLKMTDFYVPE